MSDWKTYKLAEIVDDVAMGPFGSNLKVDNFINAGVPVIRGSNLNKGGFQKDNFVFVSEEKAKSLKRCLAYPDDLVFTHRGTIGQVGIIPHNQYPYYLVSQSQMRLSVNKEYIDSKFLYYFFLSPFGQRELLKNASQVGVPAIANPTKSLKDVNVLVPPLIEQSRIASILSSLDNKIELNLQMNKTLDSIAQAIFKEWFVNFQFPGFGGELVDGLPKGWRKERLGDAIEVKGGSTPSTTVQEFWDGGFHWATPKDLSSIQSPVLLNTERTITEEGVKQISSGILPKGTLLLSSRAPIGYLAISQIPVSINQCFIAIQGKTITNMFMLFWLRKNMDIVKSRANGSTFQEISKSNFKDIEVIIPSPELRETYDRIVVPIFEKIVTNVRQNQSITELRDTLLPKLMTGKIRVA